MEAVAGWLCDHCQEPVPELSSFVVVPEMVAWCKECCVYHRLFLEELDIPTPSNGQHGCWGIAENVAKVRSIPKRPKDEKWDVAADVVVNETVVKEEVVAPTLCHRRYYGLSNCPCKDCVSVLTIKAQPACKSTNPFGY
jgi:hypothetical protein